MTKPLWLALAVAALLGTGYGWLRAERERARQQGIAEQMSKQADHDRLAFDSAVAAHVESQRAANERLARLASDSAANAVRVGVLAGAASTSRQRADSLLREIRDQFPELAGELAEIQAARDTAELRLLAEQDGRAIAERSKQEEHAGRLAAEALLVTANALIAEQATTIKQLQKVGSGGRGVTAVDVVLAAAAVTGWVVALTR